MDQDNHNESANEESNDSRGASPGRRRLLQALGVGGAVLGAQTLPEKWTRPIVDGVTLPAHAQTSPAGRFYGQTLETVETDALDLARLGRGGTGGQPAIRLLARGRGSWLDYVIPQARATEDTVAVLEASVDEDGDCTVSLTLRGTVPDGCEGEEIQFTICWQGEFADVKEGKGANLSADCPDPLSELNKLRAVIADLSDDELALLVQIGPGGPGDETRIDLVRSDERPRCPSCKEELLELKEACEVPGP